jgi:excisionase family DNA binding protein
VIADPATEWPALMKVPEVAELFRVDPETVRVWVRIGKLRAHRNPGGRVLVFRRADVFALFNGADADPEPKPSAQNEDGLALAIPAPGEPLIEIGVSNA